MKKLAVLFASLMFVSSYSFAGEPFLYKQTDENTVEKQETTVTVDKNGRKIYKIKSSGQKSTSTSGGVSNSGKNNSDEIYSETNKNSKTTYDSPIGTSIDDTVNNKNKGNKNNRVKNISGTNSDYLIAPANTDLSGKLSSAVTKINDPYVIKIDGIKYYMVRNSATGVYTLDNILGYGDEKSSLFNSLKNLNSDGDNTKLTKDELKAAQIRFVAVDSNGKLQLNNKSKDFVGVEYIDLSNTRESINKGAIGSFGYYDVYIKDIYGNTKKIIGYVSFDSDEELLEMID